VNNENPYASPSSTSHDHDAPHEAAESLSRRNRLTDQQVQWLTQSRYGMRILYVTVGFFVLMSAGQVLFMCLFLGPGSEFPVDDQVWNQTLVVNAVRIGIGTWIALAMSRLDRAVGQVVEHDAASATVNRALRLGRNAFAALGAAVLAMIVFAIVFVSTWL
jgi:hypothetical protein